MIEEGSHVKTPDGYGKVLYLVGRYAVVKMDKGQRRYAVDELEVVEMVVVG
jgi:hypothetical protein